MNPKIVIIGAGLSGIAAGSRLYENGFKNLTILEAENRIGGRVHTIPWASNVVDLGAQWCHGEVGNVVCEMGRKYNLFDSATTKYNLFECRRSDGKMIEQDKSDKLGELCISIIELYKDELKEFSGSFGEFILNKYFTSVKNIQDFKDIDPELAQQFIDFFHKYENSIECSDTWFETSCRGYLEYHDCAGDRLLNWKDKGSKSILDILMKKIPDQSKQLPLEILLNKSVSRITYDKGPNFKNEVHCSDGTIYSADHIIVTVSLGVLKERHLQLFDPPLPIPKQNAINGFSIGTVNKIYLEFKNPFWNKNWLGFGLLWTVEDLKSLKNSKDEWLTHVFGFFPVDYQPNILCGWISGPNARHMENLSNDEIRRSVTWLLRKFYKSHDVPDPINVLTTAWYSNPNFRGSYTFHSVAGDNLNAKASDLAQPIANSLGIPALLFAGEATHDHYFSTVHGAVETGWREAKRLKEFYEFQLIKSKQQNYDILILGAGCAGLGAGWFLKNNTNYNFAIIEAQHKVGGRVDSVAMKSFDGKGNQDLEFVENGAQWMHGKQNRLYEMAKKFDLIDETQSDEGLGIFIREDGFVVDEFFVKKIDFKIGQILESCNVFTTNTNHESYPSSVGVYLHDEFKKYVVSLENEQEKEMAWQLYDWHVRFQVTDNSCLDLNDVSAKYWGDYCFNGEDCQAHWNFKKPGFSEVLNKIAENIGEHNIFLNKEVSLVDWNNGKCRVQCSDGSSFTSDHIIITFSLGVLKSKQLFTKNIILPEKLLNTIEDMGFNAIDKIFLKFDHSWWGDLAGVQFLWKDGSSYAHEGWLRHISGFDVVHPGPQHTILGWIGGVGAIEMEKLSDHEIIDGCVKLFERFFKKPIPYPIKYFCSRWYSNEHIRGAYSFTSTCLDKHETKISMLSQPITLADINDPNIPSNPIKDKPIILFSGEACHTDYFSTTHGAFEHGISQAEKIIDFNNSQSDLSSMKVISHL